MFKLLFIMLFICFIFLFLKFHNKIKIIWSSFKEKGLPRIDDMHGVYLVHGKQGSNKSY